MKPDDRSFLAQSKLSLLTYIRNEIGIRSEKLLKAFSLVPREDFVSKEYRKFAYLDKALPIEEDQTISQPSLVIIMTDLLKLTGKEKVLEIGTGSGYQTALLAHLAAKVYSVERYKNLCRKATILFKKLQLKNIKTFCRDGTLGLKEKAPFDRILVTAGAKEIPYRLLEQLNDPGRMVIPVGENFMHQKLKVIDKEKGKISVIDLDSVSFVPLVGSYS